MNGQKKRVFIELFDYKPSANFQTNRWLSFMTRFATNVILKCAISRSHFRATLTTRALCKICMNQHNSWVLCSAYKVPKSRGNLSISCLFFSFYFCSSRGPKSCPPISTRIQMQTADNPQILELAWLLRERISKSPPLPLARNKFLHSPINCTNQ